MQPRPHQLDEVRLEDPGNRTGRPEQNTSQWGSPNSAPTGRVATPLNGGGVLGRVMAGLPAWVGID